MCPVFPCRFRNDDDDDDFTRVLRFLWLISDLHWLTSRNPLGSGCSWASVLLASGWDPDRDGRR